MSADSVNDPSESQVNRLVSFLGEGVVLLPCEKGMKPARERMAENHHRKDA